MARVLRGEGCSASAALLGYEDLRPKPKTCSPVSFSRAGASAAAPASPMSLSGRRAVLVGGRSDRGYAACGGACEGANNVMSEGNGQGSLRAIEGFKGFKGY